MGKTGNYYQSVKAKLGNLWKSEASKILTSWSRDLWTRILQSSSKRAQAHVKRDQILLVSLSSPFLWSSAVLLRFTESSTSGSPAIRWIPIWIWEPPAMGTWLATKCHRTWFPKSSQGEMGDGPVSLAYFISGKTPRGLIAEINDTSCLQTGCHKIEDLQEIWL